jgi:hypothetical protein
MSEKREESTERELSFTQPRIQIFFRSKIFLGQSDGLCQGDFLRCDTATIPWNRLRARSQTADLLPAIDLLW